MHMYFIIKLMNLKGLVTSIIQYHKNKNTSELSTIELYRKQLQYDVITAFELSQPIIEKNLDLFRKSPSFLSFLFTLNNIDLNFEKVVTLNDEQNVCLQKIKQLERKINNLTEPTNSTETNKLEIDIDNLKEKLNKCEDEKSKFSLENKEIKTRCNQLEQQCEELRNKNDQCNSDFQELLSKYSYQNSSKFISFIEKSLNLTYHFINTFNCNVNNFECILEPMKTNDKIIQYIEKNITETYEKALTQTIHYVMLIAWIKFHFNFNTEQETLAHINENLNQPILQQIVSILPIQNPISIYDNPFKSITINNSNPILNTKNSLSTLFKKKSQYDTLKDYELQIANLQKQLLDNTVQIKSEESDIDINYILSLVEALSDSTITSIRNTKLYEDIINEVKYKLEQCEQNLDYCNKHIHKLKQCEQHLDDCKKHINILTDQYTKMRKTYNNYIDEIYGLLEGENYVYDKSINKFEKVIDILKKIKRDNDDLKDEIRRCNEEKNGIKQQLQDYIDGIKKGEKNDITLQKQYSTLEDLYSNLNLDFEKYKRSKEQNITDLREKIDFLKEEQLELLAKITNLSNENDDLKRSLKSETTSNESLNSNIENNILDKTIEEKYKNCEQRLKDCEVLSKANDTIIKAIQQENKNLKSEKKILDSKLASLNNNMMIEKEFLMKNNDTTNQKLVESDKKIQEYIEIVAQRDEQLTSITLDFNLLKDKYNEVKGDLEKCNVKRRQLTEEFQQHIKTSKKKYDTLLEKYHKLNEQCSSELDPVIYINPLDDKFKRESAELENTIKIQDETIQKLQLKNKQQNEELATIQTKFNLLENDLEECNTAKKVKTEQLQQHINEIQEKYDKLLENYEKKNAQCSSELNTINIKALDDKFKRENVQLENTLKLQNETIQKLEQEIKQLKLEKKNLESTNESLKIDFGERKKILDMHIAQLEAELDSHKTTSTKTESKYILKTRDVPTAIERRRQSKNEKIKKQTTIDEDCEHLLHENEELKIKINTLEKKMQKYETDIQSYKVINENYKQQLADTIAKNSQQNLITDDLNTKYETEIQTLTSRANRYMDLYNNLNEENTQLKERITECTTQLDNIILNEEVHKRDLEKASSNIDTLKQEKDKIKIKHKKLKRDIDVYKQNIEDLKKEITQKNNRIKSLNQKIEAFDLALKRKKPKTFQCATTSDSSEMYAFSKPYNLEPIIVDEYNEDDYLSMDIPETTYTSENQSDLLRRCIEEKSYYVQELDKCKQKLEHCNQLEKDAHYVTASSNEKLNLTIANFKLLFIAFYKYHFEKWMHLDKINFAEEDRKSLNDLKQLLEDIQNANKDDYVTVLIMYIQKQISTLTGDTKHVHLDDMNSINDLLTYTSHEIESFIRDFRIERELDNFFANNLKEYILPNDNAQEAMFAILTIIRNLKNIFQTVIIDNISAQVKKLNNLIDTIYPKFIEHAENIDKGDLLGYLLDELHKKMTRF